MSHSLDSRSRHRIGYAGATLPSRELRNWSRDPLPLSTLDSLKVDDIVRIGILSPTPTSKEIPEMVYVAIVDVKKSDEGKIVEFVGIVQDTYRGTGDPGHVVNGQRVEFESEHILEVPGWRVEHAAEIASDEKN
eukprot:c23010_g1_i1.p2 GENE.c23010_g1_i1~~c23010_g1_i1.p2  ORF type:complete len:134 (-),score=26.85 c23010_g1_i1:137-538(-)